MTIGARDQMTLGLSVARTAINPEFYGDTGFYDFDCIKTILSRYLFRNCGCFVSYLLYFTFYGWKIVDTKKRTHFILRNCWPYTVCFCCVFFTAVRIIKFWKFTTQRSNIVCNFQLFKQIIVHQTYLKMYLHQFRIIVILFLGVLCVL